eukprot:CAMPEP_0172315314 /NCGR_PEP_ID=MMETSP1058-20130122/24810_1 /TAXON_ID=83371 /ORGANISM="Detonula confervacea, Strain CCMP 353" /LENGTH=383 /DNA_ID=CAMNT_0013029369 /DNA_START=64 /DNA_END=1215 /DNA_ORIENTATION=-
MTSKDSDGEREAKKLRSSEPDLKVILGSRDGMVTKWYHSITLTSKSRYIDAMLSSPMKEKEESTISFPDIDNGVWEEMMKFLESPVAIRRMKVEDALNVAKFYDKYEFEEGTILCDQVLGDYVKSAKHMETDLSLDVDLLVDAVVIAQEANLMDTLRRGLKYCWDKMHITDVPYGRTMFTEDHLKKLAPIFSDSFTPENKERIGDGVAWFNGFYRPFSDTIRPFGLKLDQPDFPEAYVSKTTHWLEESLLHRCINGIVLSGAGEADGPYDKDEDEFMSDQRCYIYKCSGMRMRWGGKIVTFSIQLCDKGWAIMRQYPAPRNNGAAQNNQNEESDDDAEILVEKLCWVSPCSSNLHFPPLNSWKSVDPLARGNPKIRYILNDEL